MKEIFLAHPMISFFVSYKRRQGTKEVSIYNNYVLKLFAFFEWLIRVYPSYNGTPLNEVIVANVTSEQLRDYKTYLLKQISNQKMSAIGAKRSLQYVKSFFRVLYQKKRIPVDIAESVVNIKADDYKFRQIPDDDQIQLFFDAVDRYAVDPQMERLAYLLMLDVGLRASEVAKLKWQDLNLSTRTIAINDTKGHNAILPLPLAVMNQLLLYRESQSDLSGEKRVFYQMKPKSLTSHLYQMFKMYWLVIGFKAEGGVHFFRHSFVTRLANKQCMPGTLMYLSRHNSTKSLPLYLHSSKPQLVGEINKLSIFE